MENIIIINFVVSSDEVGFDHFIYQLRLLLTILLYVYLVAESYVLMLVDV